MRSISRFFNKELKMKTDEIYKEYSKFDIVNIPKYENPKKFASQFKRCSILKYSNITYSNTTSSISKKHIV